MRRHLIVGATAIIGTILIAFVVPLGLAVRVLAANRPLNDAEQTAQSVATVLALTDDRRVITEAVVAAQARSDAQLTVFRRDGSRLGEPASRTPDVQRAFAGASFAAPSGDGRAVFVPATRADGTVAVVQAVVPGELLGAGVARSWLLLLGLAVVLFLVALAITDWLARSVVRPVGELAATARKISDGDLDARVVPDGPPEVADVGRALNGLAVRIKELLAAEREMVADLSHRLRTPLTALRLDAEAVAEPADRQRLRADVDALEATVTELIREARQPSTTPPDHDIDVVPIVRERAAYWGALADDQDRRWTLDVESEPVLARLRAGDVEALLDVLLDNVFTHTPEGTPYWISLADGCLVVEDGGPGLDPEHASHRGRSSGGSTGLGLDIARQTAERAGGALAIAARDGGGARVEVRLASHLAS